MTLYRFHGPDSSSDFGCWEMLIEARTRAQALAAAKQSLRDNNRPELLDAINGELLPRKTGTGVSIIHSTLESRCDGN